MGFFPTLGFTIARFCEFYLFMHSSVDLRLAFTHCADNFINCTYFIVEDLMRRSLEYLHTKGQCCSPIRLGM